MHEKAKFVCFNFYATAKSEIQICSNKHETCLVTSTDLAIICCGMTCFVVRSSYSHSLNVIVTFPGHIQCYFKIC